MSAKDKSHFNFLIAFARQLDEAMLDDPQERKDELGLALELALARLQHSLGLLLADGQPEAGEDPDGDDDGGEAIDDAAGDDATVGGEPFRRPQVAPPMGGAPAYVGGARVRRGLGAEGVHPNVVHEPPPGAALRMNRGRARKSSSSSRKGARRGKK